MDNGHPSNSGKTAGIFSGPDRFFQSQPQDAVENPYFTAGAGDASPEINNDPENSLDEEVWQKSLDVSVPTDLPTPEKPLSIPERETSKTESSKIPSPDAESRSAESLPPSANPFELGQIAPTTPKTITTPAQPVNQSHRYNPAHIKTTGDHLEKTTIPEVDNVIEELSQTGDLRNFYDEIRGTDEKPGMVEANLHNSFNRRLGEDKNREEGK